MVYIGVQHMGKPNGIIILGANGSGKSTLGRELARLLNYAHFDKEDYFFHETKMPFTIARSHKERKEMLLSDIEKQGSFVLSGDVYNWGEQFKPLIDLMVHLEAPTEIRIERIERRQQKRFGDRIKMGGDMYEQQLKFVEFATNRSIDKIKERAFLYPCSKLFIDGTKPLNEITDEILSNIET